MVMRRKRVSKQKGFLQKKGVWGMVEEKGRTEINRKEVLSHIVSVDF